MPGPLSPELPDIAASGPNQIFGGLFSPPDFSLTAGVEALKALCQQQ